MIEIALREFQLHPTQYLKKLPLVLTQYNKPIAQIVPFVNTSVNSFPRTIKDTANVLIRPIRRMPMITKQIPTEEMTTDALEQGRCEAPNIICKNLGYEYIVTFMTDEGEKKKKVFLCGLHLRKAKDSEMEVKEI
jgi:antitoxin (DNA-binding transcriptional repressor) of toxin-antitoxin stability system